jgi:hypothetical protein
VIVPAQDNLMVQTQLQYNAMQIGVFQLLEARRAQLDVALDFVETQREYWSAVAELDALLAGRRVGQSAAEPSGAMGMAIDGPRQGGH